MDYKFIEQILTEAQQEINEPYKWCQGRLYSGKASCMEGAFSEPLKQTGLNYYEKTDIFRTCSSLLCDLLNWPRESLFRWNDVQGRTYAEVMAAFDMAIAYCQVHQENVVTDCQQQEKEIGISIQ